jgi:hypothetical protein
MNLDRERSITKIHFTYGKKSIQNMLIELKLYFSPTQNTYKYILLIYTTEPNMSKLSKKQININDLLPYQHEEFIQQKYLLPQLKLICNRWKLSNKGKKQEIKDRIYHYMKTQVIDLTRDEPTPKDNKHVITIQQWIRSIFPRIYIQNKHAMVAPRHDRTISMESENSIVDDPSSYNSIFRKIAEYEKKCIVENDFLSIEPIHKLPHYQRIMFRENNVIYGFDLSSFYQYMAKCNIRLNTFTSFSKITLDACKNPYTRQSLSANLIRQVRRHLVLCRILKFPIDIGEPLTEPTNTIVATNGNEYIRQNYTYYMRLNLSPSERLHRRIADMFQYFDTFGNYTNTQWFMELNFSRCCHFLRELKDIWEYRSQISQEVRHNICPNSHIINSLYNPFYNIHPILLQSIYQEAPSIEKGLQNVKHRVLDVIDRMTKYGITEDYRAIAVTFVLSALTLVSQEAAVAMPWLFSTVV